MKRYIIEIRDGENRLDFKKWNKKEKEHPYLFSKPTFTMDELCYYASFGQNRNNPSGPGELAEFMKKIDIRYREKTW